MENILKEAKPIETLQLSWNNFKHLNSFMICEHKPNYVVIKLHNLSRRVTSCDAAVIGLYTHVINNEYNILYIPN